MACGDGLSAALAASTTWEGLLGCPVEAVPAMTFSRYRVQNAGAGALAVVISQSGQVVRVIEALACALRHGLETLVVTNQPDSPLRRLTPEGRIFELGFKRLGFHARRQRLHLYAGGAVRAGGGFQPEPGREAGAAGAARPAAAGPGEGGGDRLGAGGGICREAG